MHKMLIKSLVGSGLAVAAAIAAVPASATNVTTTTAPSTITLTFGGQVNDTAINTFFDGGTDAYGTAGGAANNVGVTFSAPAEFANAGATNSHGTGFNGGTGAFENAPVSTAGVLEFAAIPTTTALVMDDAAGFSSLGLTYSLYNNQSTYDSTVQLYSGLDGTGTLLGTISLGPNGTTTACTNAHDFFCSWSATNSGFVGIAESAVFTGDSRSFTAFDSVTVAPVPLPAAVWFLVSGLGGLGVFRRGNRTKAA